MVKGIEALRRKMARVAPAIAEGMRDELQRIAIDVAAQIAAVKPLPNIVIAWTWGAAPAGGVSLGEVRSDAAGPRITIYATATTAEFPGGFPGVARWFEFGTAERFHKDGKSVGRIAAQPYFYPTYRANKASIRSKIGRRVRKEVVKLNGAG